MVLLKGVDERGFVFYTNMDSQRAGNWTQSRKRRWRSTGNRWTVRSGCAAPSSGVGKRSGHVFRHPSQQAQIGAWASNQSAPLESRMAFEKAVALYARNTGSARYRDRRTGRVTASCRRRSSSGRSGHFACTNASNSAASPTRRGTKRGTIRKQHQGVNTRLEPFQEWHAQFLLKQTSRAGHCS